MNKRLATIAAIILLVLIPAFSTAWAASWVKQFVYDPSVSSQTRENFQKAVDTMDELFTKYEIVVSNPVTVVVTADDDESYIRALMVYGNESRAAAENTAKQGIKAVSSRKKHAILIRNTFILSTYYGAAARRDLTHELFHQVRCQNYSHARPVNWLEEGPAVLFANMALEIARYDYVTNRVQQAEQRIREAPKIPDTRQLASYDYKTWIPLLRQEYPVYDMAMLMTYRLVGDNGFEKVILYYQLLDNGSDPDTAFITAFGTPMSVALDDMNEYFNKLRSKKE